MTESIANGGNRPDPTGGEDDQRTDEVAEPSDQPVAGGPDDEGPPAQGEGAPDSY